MKVDNIFPTAAEVEYLTDIRVSNNPNLSRSQAQEQIMVELCGITKKVDCRAVSALN